MHDKHRDCINDGNRGQRHRLLERSENFKVKTWRMWWIFKQWQPTKKNEKHKPTAVHYMDILLQNVWRIQCFKQKYTTTLTPYSIQGMFPPLNSFLLQHWSLFTYKGVRCKSQAPLFTATLGVRYGKNAPDAGSLSQTCLRDVANFNIMFVFLIFGRSYSYNPLF